MKPKKLAPPSVQSIELVLNQASKASLQNMDHAKAVDTALNEVAAFFRALLAPQTSEGRASPTAPATDAGKPSSQS